MTEASAHDEEVEDFVVAEAPGEALKNLRFDPIDYSADCIDQSACQKPGEAFSGQGVNKRAEYKNTKPSHHDIDDGTDPFGAADEPYL